MERKRSPQGRRVAVLAADGFEMVELLVPLIERATDDARLQVPIAAVYPLSRAARAHEHLEQGHVIGRIVLRVRGVERLTASRAGASQSARETRGRGPRRPV